PAVATPSVAPATNGNGGATIRERLGQLKMLLDEGLITEDDFNRRKASILGEV
ncbi:MAG: SHOCT domain-containing protein, partial [Cytophagales bacterium]|nr:SHOCT domain-containing protein [Armatimonadota bacterium]